jgi:hypothetical protein
VTSVGAVSHLPLSGANAGRSFSIDGRVLPPGENASASYRLTCPGYFTSLGITLLKGRDFDVADTLDAPAVVIINAETAKRYWPGEDPIGRRIKLGRRESSNPWMTVVGVVGNVRHFGPRRHRAARDVPPLQPGRVAGDDDRHQDGERARVLRRRGARGAAAGSIPTCPSAGRDDGERRAELAGLAAVSDDAARRVRDRARSSWRWSASMAW